jgi:hypothetical protein
MFPRALALLLLVAAPAWAADKPVKVNLADLQPPSVAKERKEWIAKLKEKYDGKQVTMAGWATNRSKRAYVDLRPDAKATTFQIETEGIPLWNPKSVKRAVIVAGVANVTDAGKLRVKVSGVVFP